MAQPGRTSLLARLLGAASAPDPALLLQALAEASAQARVITRPKAGVLAANAGYRRLVERLGLAGLPEPAVLLTAPHVCARLAQQALTDGPAGEEIHVGERLYRAVVFRRAEGDELIWDLQDVTADRAELEAAARQRDALAGFLDNAPVGLYSVAPDGRFLFANQTFAAWLGLTGDALVARGTTIGEVLQHAARAENAAPRPIAPDWEGGEAKLVPLRDADLTPSVAVRLVAVTQAPVPGPSGRPERFSAVVHDLSRELRLRGTLRPVEAEFRRFFDQAPIGILVLDSAGAIVDANAAFSSLCGRADWLDQRLAALVREEDGPELNRYLMAVRRGESAPRPLVVRFPGDPAQGSRERVAEVFAASVPPSGDGNAAQLVYIVDTTEQSSLQAQFNQSQKMQAVGQLAGGIAHDFNNLLTAMIGFCDLLLQRHQPGDQSFADVMQVKQNANRAANLVRQLLAFSRQQTLVPKVLDVTDVLADLRNLIGRLIGETIQLKLTHGRDLGLVKVDQGQFEQVIINLAVNARDAMLGSGGGELRIRTANWRADRPVARGGETVPPGDYVLIEVEDTGHGIAPEHLGKIFDPFFTTKAVGAGTGLGLATVYGIIKQTGGFIQVESPPGQGATFRILLPRHVPTTAEMTAGREDAKAQNRDLTGQGLVLLVEDEDAVRSFAARALRNKGYTVIEAASGEQALALSADQLARVEVLISDVVMPVMDGPTLAAKLREQRPALKVLFISGYAEDGLRNNLAQSGPVDFLPKPFSLSQLAGKLKEVMDRAS